MGAAEPETTHAPLSHRHRRPAHDPARPRSRGRLAPEELAEDSQGAEQEVGSADSPARSAGFDADIDPDGQPGFQDIASGQEVVEHGEEDVALLLLDRNLVVDGRQRGESTEIYDLGGDFVLLQYYDDYEKNDLTEEGTKWIYVDGQSVIDVDDSEYTYLAGRTGIDTYRMSGVVFDDFSIERK